MQLLSQGHELPEPSLPAASQETKPRQATKTAICRYRASPRGQHTLRHAAVRFYTLDCVRTSRRQGRTWGAERGGLFDIWTLQKRSGTAW